MVPAEFSGDENTLKVHVFLLKLIVGPFTIILLVNTHINPFSCV